MGFDLWEEAEKLMGEPGDGVWLDLSEAVGTRGSHRRGDRDREGTPGEKGFSINKTAGQILAGLWKRLHPVPEASSELLLAYYWQLVLWAQPCGGWGGGRGQY